MDRTADPGRIIRSTVTESTSRTTSTFPGLTHIVKRMVSGLGSSLRPATRTAGRYRISHAIANTAERFLLRLSGRCLRRWPLAAISRRLFRARANIVYYHAVWRRADPRMSLFGGVDLDDFASDLKALRRFFDFVPLQRLLEDGGPRESRRPTLAVTFDDGYDLIGGGAADVLDELGISATAFVNTNSVRYDRLMWQHRIDVVQALRGTDVVVRELNRIQERIGSDTHIRSLAERTRATRRWPVSRKEELTDLLWSACDMPPMDELLAEHRPYLDWQGLREWLDRGHHVGHHTASHPFCSHLTIEDLAPEFFASAAELRGRLSLGSIPFAYPFGERSTPGVEADLVRSGVFSCLLGTGGFSPHATPTWNLRRQSAERGIDAEVFGRPILREFIRRRL